MIEHYSFGKMVINGKSYTSDVILSGDVVIDHWWRKKGHELCVADIESAVEKFDPTTLVLGTGKFGLMKVLPETKAYFQDRGIELIAQKTAQACETYNRLSAVGTVLGAFHLTC